jgi:hypothetical protein
MADVVLMLNSNYEPIHVCNLRRAIGLILMEKAHLVANGRGEIHSANRSYPRPSVIRLSNYTCQYCGKHTPDLTIDHVLPRHLGGQHLWTNVVAACPSCNHRKGGRTLETAGMRLLRQPKEPPASALYVFGWLLDQYHEWEGYLTGW